MSAVELRSSVSMSARLASLSLFEANVRPRTSSLYRTAAASFMIWYERQSGSFSSMFHIDSHLAIYLDDLYNSQTVSFGFANQVVFGLMHLLPSWKHQLPMARRALSGWKKLRKTHSYPPMCWDLVCLLAVQMATVGWYDEALVTLIAYDGYFRTASELLTLKVKHIGVSTKSAAQSLSSSATTTYYLRLKHTKTGANKLVTLTKPVLGSALLSFARIHDRSDNEVVFQFSGDHYRKRFKHACEMLGWGSVGFVPHSLRHGHATDDFEAGVPIEDILVRARWASIQSTRRYIQSGRAHLIRGRLNSILPPLPSYQPADVLVLVQEAYLRSLPQ